MSSVKKEVGKKSSSPGAFFEKGKKSDTAVKKGKKSDTAVKKSGKDDTTTNPSSKKWMIVVSVVVVVLLIVGLYVVFFVFSKKNDEESAEADSSRTPSGGSSPSAGGGASPSAGGGASPPPSNQVGGTNFNNATVGPAQTGQSGGWDQVRWLRLDRRKNPGSELKFFVLYATFKGTPLPYGHSAFEVHNTRIGNNPSNTQLITVPSDQKGITWYERAYNPKNTNEWQFVDTIVVKLDPSTKAGTFVVLLNPLRGLIWEYEFKESDPNEMTFTYDKNK